MFTRTSIRTAALAITITALASIAIIANPTGFKFLDQVKEFFGGAPATTHNSAQIQTEYPATALQPMFFAGETAFQDFGTGTGSNTSQTAVTNLFPAPTGTGAGAATTYARGGASAPAAPVVVANTSNPLGTTGSFMRAVASSSTSVTKASPFVGYTGTAEFYTSFKVLFGDSSGGATATSGSWTYSQGAGAVYSDNNSFSTTQAFAALRFTYASGGIVTLTYQNSSAAFSSTSLTTTGFVQGVPHTVEVVGNNKTSGTINYTHNGIARTVAVQRMDLYIDGILIGDDLIVGSASTLPAGTAINAAMFTGISSTSNVANLFVDDMATFSSVPATIASVTKISSFPYSETFESSSGGYLSQLAGGSVNDWVVGTPAKTQIAGAHGGTKAWVTKTSGVYSNSHNAAVTSPVFDFTGFSDPTLTFWQNMNTTTAEVAGWDSGVVELSTDGGTTWNKVDANLGTGGTFNTTNSTGWYNSSSSNGPITPPKFNGKTTAYTGAVSGWIQSTTLLTGAGGQSNVRVRWRFGSDSSTGDEGWAIDDIGITASPLVTNDVQASAFVDPTSGGTKQTTGFAPQASFKNNGTAAQTNVPVRYRICTDGTCTTELYNETSTIASLASGASTTVTFAATGALTAGTYTIKAKAELVGDTVSANDEISGTVTIAAPLAGDYTVGSGGAYTTLTQAVADLNARGVSASVRFLLTDAAYSSETLPITINAVQGSSATKTVTIKPNTGVTSTISGAAASNPVFKFNGASYVTIDGSNAPNGNDRSLSVTNTSTTSPEVIRLTSIGTTAIAGVAVKNSVLTNGVNSSSAVVIEDSGTVTGAYFNGLTIDNNDIRKAYIGIYGLGVSANASNLSITNNLLNATSTNAIRLLGIYVQAVDGATVSGNTIGNLEATSAESKYGIWLASNVINSTISGNTISTITSPSTGTAYGINVTPGVATSNNILRSNTISGITASINSSTTPPAGISVGSGAETTTGGVTIERNNITNIRNLHTSTYGAYGMYLNGGNNLTVQNNFVSSINHDMSGGAAFDPIYAPIGIYVKTGTGHKIYNNSVNLSGALLGTGTSSLLDAAFAINATTSTGVDVRNNIFANNMTGGTTSIAHASVYLPSGATSAMNLTWNNNAYYSGSTAASQGIAQVGTTAGTGFYLAGNFNAASTSGSTNLRTYTSALLAANTNNDNASLASTAAVPFTSATDLHLATPGSLRDAGVTIASVTNDYDGTSRPIGPAYEIGADEVSPGTIALSAATYTDSETNSDHVYNIPVKRTGGSDGAVSVNYSVTDGTATVAGGDYTATASGTLNWAAGDTADKNIAITVKGDTTFEPDETVNIAITSPTGGATLGSPNSAVLTITNDDAASTNAKLQSISTANPTTTLDPAFDPNSGGPYFATVPVGTTNIDILATAQDANGSVSINGVDYTLGSATWNVALPDIGYNPFTITGKAQDGTTTKSYVLQINRPSPNTDPVPQNASATVTNGNSVNILLTATDADGDTMTFYTDPGFEPDHGTVTYGPATCDGQTPSTCQSVATYTSTDAFTGGDSFLYIVDDSQGGTSNDAEVTIAITLAACYPAPSGMTAWFRGENNAVDVFGNDGQPVNTPGYGIGKVGAAFSFDASLNQGVTVPHGAGLDPTDAITMDAWVKPSSYPNAAASIVRKDVSPGSPQYLMALVPTGEAHCNIDGLAPVGGSVPIGVWSHVACTYDRQNVRLYVNGVQVASMAGTQAIPTSTSNLAIGKEDLQNDRNFDGMIDEVEIFSTALSGTEIAGIYNAGSAGKCSSSCYAAPSDMVLWHKAEDNAIDTLGTHHGNPAGVNFANGRVGRAYSFDGNDGGGSNVGNITDLDITATGFTVDTWAKAAGGVPTGHKVIVEKWHTNGTGWAIQNEVNSGQIHFIVGTSAGDPGTFVRAVSTTNVFDGNWHHITGTYDGTSLRIYIDGVLEGTQSTSAPVPNGGTLHIGYWEEPGSGAKRRVFNGLIDELEIFTRALSLTEIQGIYRAGMFGKCPVPPAVSTDGPTGVTFTSATLHGTVISDGGGSAVTDRGFVYGTSPNATISDNKTQVGSGTGTFALPLTTLLPGTTYYYKAYAINGAGTRLGLEQSFTTGATTPSITDSDPDSPSNSNAGLTPRIIGTATPGSNVTLYSTSNCASGSEIGSGTASLLGAFDIGITVNANSINPIYARASNPAGTSACSSPAFEYIHDNLVPTAPTFNPTSAAGSSQTPTVTGNADANTSVQLYLGDDCQGAAIGAAQNTGAGNTFAIQINVVPNVITYVSAKSTDAALNSTCSAGTFAYRHDDISPTLTIDTNPPSQTMSTSATFTFSSANNNRPEVTAGHFECALDLPFNYSICTSPKTYTGLGVGSHTFKVKAVDSANNESSAAEYTWEVVETCTTSFTTPAANGLLGGIQRVYANGNTLYAATLAGLAISTDDGATFTNRNTSNGLGNNYVRDAFTDGSSVYAATMGGLSISTNAGSSFANRTTADGLGSNEVVGVFASGPNVYAATSGGLSISTDGGISFTNKTVSDGLGDDYVLSVYVDGGTIYAGTYGGISISTDGGSTWTTRTMADGLGEDRAFDLWASGTTVVAATTAGLSVSTDGGATFVNRTTADGMLADNVTGIEVLNGTIYAATAGGGLAITSDNGATFTNKGRADGLGSKNVNSVAIGSTKIFAATNAGLSVSSCDPPPGMLVFDTPTYSAAEDSGTAQIAVKRVGGSFGSVSSLFMTNGGTATSGSDYQPLSTTVTFSDGETGPINITPGITLNSDAVYELDQTVDLSLGDDGDDYATLTITNDDAAPTIAIGDWSAFEGDGPGTTIFTFTVVRTGETELTHGGDYITVGDTGSNGLTATNGNCTNPGDDFFGESNSFTIPPGGAYETNTIFVAVCTDTTVEPDETFSVDLTNPTNGATYSDASGLGTILNDDAVATTYTVGGSVSGLSGTLKLKNNGTDELTRTSDGSFTFPTALNDNSNYEVTVSQPPSRQVCTVSNGSGTISGADVTDVTVNCVSLQPGDIKLDQPSYSTSEGNTGSHTVDVHVQRTGGSDGAVSVDYAITDVTATFGPGEDYTVSPSTSGTLNWADGDSTDKTLTFTINGDTIFEGDEVVNIAISNALGGATIVTPNGADLTIMNDDAAPTISVSDVTSTEGDGPGTKVFTFTITRTGETAFVHGGNFSTVGAGEAVGPTAIEGVCTNPGDDFLGVGGNFGIFPGGPSGTTTVNVQVCPDTTYESNETFFLDLTAPTNGATYADAQGLGTITNDDPIPVSLEVTDLDDNSPVGCYPEHCNLREAIAAANVNADANTITFKTGLTGTILLGSELPFITKPVTIAGPGAGVIAVSGQDTVRILTINNPNPTVFAYISGLTLRDGFASGDDGGAIRAFSGLFLTDCAVISSSAAAQGGGIYAGADLGLLNTSVIDNTANSGGGISGIGSFTIVGSTIAQNQAASGGGMNVSPSPQLAIVNSTISENNSTGQFGGIQISGGTTEIVNATIFNNHSNGLYSGLGTGLATINVRNTIIAGNNSTLGTSVGQDVAGTFVSRGNNLIGRGDGSSGFVNGTNGDHVGSNASPLPSYLKPLANNGGLTPTNELQVPSVAIDGGNDCVVNNSCTPSYGATLPTDQRGTGFPRSVDGNGDSVSHVDIGAFEAATAPSLTIDDVSQNEGNSGSTDMTFTVTRSGDLTGTTTVNVFAPGTGTASLGSDCTNSATGGDDYYDANFVSYTFAPTEATKTYTIKVCGDTFSEANETLDVVLNGVVGATVADSTGVGTILNDDSIITVSLSVDTNAASEAAATVVTVTATASAPVSGAQTVDLGVSGAGITAGDYALSNLVITIPNGSTSGFVTFTVVDDTINEGTETATLTISNPSSGITLGSPTQQNVTITDNDPAAAFSINDVTLAEGNSGTTNFTFTVTRNGGTSFPTSVDFATVNGSAAAGTDFAGQSGTLNFAASAGNATQTVTILVNGDTVTEPDESFTVNLTNAQSTPSGFATILDADGVGTILNDDCAAPPQVGNMVGWWPFQGDGGDIAGGNTASLVNTPTFASGKVGQSMQLAGAQHAFVPTAVLPANTSAFTVDLWINPSDVTTPQPLVEWNDGTGAGPGQGIGVHFWKSVAFNDGINTGGAGSLYANIRQNGIDHGVTTTTNLLVPNQWQHVVMSYDGNDFGRTKIYINGVQVANKTVTGFVPDTAGKKLYFGRRPAGIPVANFVGGMDEIEVFNKVLTLDEVQAIYNASGAGKCQVYHTLNTTAVDGTVTKSPNLTQYLEGSNVQLTANPNAGYHFVNWTGDIITTTSNPTTVTMNVDKNITANFAINQYTLTYTAGPNGTISGTSPQTVNHGANGSSVTAVPNAGYYFVNWSDGSTQNPRTDTNVQANVTVTANFAPLPSLSIDDVTKAEGNSGTTAYTFTVSRAGGNGMPSSVNFQTQDGTATVANNDYAANSGTVSFNGTDTTAQFTVLVNGDTALEPDEAFTVSLSSPTNATISDASGLGTILNDDCVAAPQLANMVAWFDGSGQPIANDIVGLNNAIWSGTASIQPGRVGQAFDFNGAQRVTTPTAGTLNLTGAQMTMDGWVYPRSNATAYYFGRTAPSNHPYVLLNIGGNLFVILTTATGTANQQFDTGFAMPSNTWTHIAMTYDASGGAQRLKVYANGNLIFTHATTGGNLVSDSPQFTIGGRPAGDTPFNGLIDEVEVFNKALTQAEIQSIVNASGAGKCHTSTIEFAAANYPVPEGVGTATITVNRIGTHDTPAAVDYATVTGGNATAGNDYTAIGTTNLAMPVGWVSKTFPVSIANDTLDEFDETINMQLSNVTGAGASIGAQTASTLTIQDDDAPPNISINDVTFTGANSRPEVVVPAGFLVTLDAPSGKSIPFHYKSSDNTATAPSDYGAVEGNMTFQPGETEKLIPITIVGDNTQEPTEDFFVDLSNVINATVAKSRGVGTIPNDDAGPVFTINDISVVETNSGTTTATFTVTKTGATAISSTIHFATVDGTATVANNDYVATSGDLIFPASTTTDTQPVTVTINGDTAVEPDEVFTVHLSAQTNGTIGDADGVGTILNDDCVAAPQLANMVAWFDGSGPTPAANDIVGTNNAVWNGTPSIQPGRVGSQAFNFNGAERVTTPTAGTLNLTGSQMTMDGWVYPRSNATAYYFGRTAPSDHPYVLMNIGGNLVVIITTATQNQQFDTGFAMPSNTWTHIAMTYDAGGGSQRLRIYVNGNLIFTAPTTGGNLATNVLPFTMGGRPFGDAFFDGLIDEVEVFNTALTQDEIQAIVNASGAGKCHTSTIQLSSNAYSITESAANAPIMLTRVGTHDTAATFNFGTSFGSATPGLDYTEVSLTGQTFDVGEVSKIVNVPVLDDSVYENAETVNLSVNTIGGPGATLGVPNTGILTINPDADAAPTLSVDDYTFSGVDQPQVCGGFNVTMSGATQVYPVSFDYHTSDGTAIAPGDYLSASGTLTFNQGDTNVKCISVTIADDNIQENDETFFMNIDNAVNATVSDGQAVGTITSTDGPPSFSINSVTVTEGNTGTTTATFTVTKTGATTLPSSVHFATGDDTATAPSDYTETSGDLDFAAGETTKEIVVTINGDTVFEADETFKVRLTLPVNATIPMGSGVGIGTITNDDCQPNPVVTNLNDSGPGSLRDWVASACSGSTVTFNIPGSGPHIIQLLSPLTISGKDLTINGPAGERVTIVGGLGVNRGKGDEPAAFPTIVIADAPPGDQKTERGGGFTYSFSNLNITGGGNPNGCGGGLSNQYATVNLNGVTIYGNTAQQGAGVCNNGSNGGPKATMNITNSTISGNTATGQGGGISNQGQNTGDAELHIVNSTIVGNSATSGAGLYNYGFNVGIGVTTIKNTIIANAAGGTNIESATGSGGSGSITSQGYNLADDGGGGFLTATGDILNTNPIIGPLANNGGPTLTHNLLNGSPALDKGGAGVMVDQRGAIRPVDFDAVPNAAGGNASDIGALEVQIATASGVTLSGRITTAEGRGITGVKVTVSGGSLSQPITVASGRSGQYTITGLHAGETYVVTVASRRFVFDEPSRIVTVTDNVTGFDFTARIP